MCELLTVQLGDPRYDEILGQIRDDPVLRKQMWSDAEHEFEELPGKVWTVAVVDGALAAWAAARVVDGVLRCSDNYERRGPGRRLGLYRQVYRLRHETVVAPSGMPAVTYLFAQPMPLHEPDGWYRTGVRGSGAHDWWELRREPGLRPVAGWHPDRVNPLV